MKGRDFSRVPMSLQLTQGDEKPDDFRGRWDHRAGGAAFVSPALQRGVADRLKVSSPVGTAPPSGGFRPCRHASRIGVALAPEGLHFQSFAFPQRLKPRPVFADPSARLKPCPFKAATFSTSRKTQLQFCCISGVPRNLPSRKISEHSIAVRRLSVCQGGEDGL